ncbi:MAG: hypothetical protein IH851_05455 [Armatimonadetes bacterium]|nr:hypothetical protein [Armatimonadota bacterium]
MVEAQYRARRAILLHSEDFTAGGSGRKGVFGIISPDGATRYVTQTVVDAANSPIWAIVVPDDDGTQPTDTITWGSLTLSILKIVERRLRGTVIFKLILAD